MTADAIEKNLEEIFEHLTKKYGFDLLALSSIAFCGTFFEKLTNANLCDEKLKRNLLISQEIMEAISNIIVDIICEKNEKKKLRIVE